MRRMLAALAILILGAPSAMAIEEPSFRLIKKEKDFEIRDYAPVIVAEVTLSGDAVRARNAGFRPLAEYIFAEDRKGEKIAMTAPVTQSPREKIAMTAPVTQAVGQGDSWTIGFTMPAKYTMATLQPPANPNVRLTEQPTKRMAVIRFSGSAGPDQMENKRRELTARLEAEGLKAVSAPTFAFYDAPWTPPFMRRNEVMVEVVVQP